MKINYTVVNEGRLFVHLDEKELEDVIVKAVASEGGFQIDENTTCKVIISKKDRAGTAGFENYAEVTLINKF